MCAIAETELCRVCCVELRLRTLRPNGTTPERLDGIKPGWGGEPPCSKF